MYDFLLFPFLFGNQYDDSLEDIMYCLNEKVRDIRLSLTFEVIELYEDKKYSYEEITQMIDNISFNEEDCLSENEKQYLKKRC